MKMKLLVVLLLCTCLTASAGTLWVGVEDLALPGGDKDYNDLVFNMSGLALAVKGSGSWMPMVTPNQDGVPYWDNSSWDGVGGWNIGYFVTATGNFAGNPRSPALTVPETLYWGVGTSFDPSFRFFSTGGVQSTILAEVAAYSGNNALYWFPVSNPSAMNLIFSGPDGVGTTASFNPGGADFGLRLLSPGGDFRTTVNGNQFSVFSQVPEPATMALLGGGLLALGFLRRPGATSKK